MIDIRVGDCREVLATLPERSVQCVVTSPPYFGLRNYGVDGQMGLEPTLTEYIDGMVEVFREVRRVLADDGTLWLNIGDSYANDGKWGGSSGGKHVTALHGDSGIGRGRRDTGLKPKDLMMVPARLALALQADGWYLRSDIIWKKPNPMPESVTDRPTSAHEHIFLLTKSARYYWDQDAVREPHSREWWAESVGPGYMTAQDGRNDGGKRQGNGDPTGRNCRNVWSIATQPFSGAHFAVFPPEIPRRCILAGSREGDTVLDPFAGAGTTGLVADRLGRSAILIELNQTYADMARNRIKNDAPLFAEVTP